MFCVKNILTYKDRSVLKRPWVFFIKIIFSINVDKISVINLA